MRQRKPTFRPLITLGEAARIMGINRNLAGRIERDALRKIQEGLRDAIRNDPKLKWQYGHVIGREPNEQTNEEGESEPDGLGTD